MFGIAAFAFGLITLVWRDYDDWRQLRYIVYVAAAAQIVGGAVIQVRRIAKMGGSVLGTGDLAFALLCVPEIVATPQIYNSWGNFFEQFALVTGAAIEYARL